jgi:hypothetical protein
MLIPAIPAMSYVFIIIIKSETPYGLIESSAACDRSCDLIVDSMDRLT